MLPSPSPFFSFQPARPKQEPIAPVLAHILTLLASWLPARPYISLRPRPSNRSGTLLLGCPPCLQAYSAIAATGRVCCCRFCSRARGQGLMCVTSVLPPASARMTLLARCSTSASSSTGAANICWHCRGNSQMGPPAMQDPSRSCPGQSLKTTCIKSVR